MNWVEVFPIVGLLSLIIGDISQLIAVKGATHCRSVSLSKWLLSMVANVAFPIYYYLNRHFISMCVNILLLCISTSIIVLVVKKRGFLQGS